MTLPARIKSSVVVALVLSLVLLLAGYGLKPLVAAEVWFQNILVTLKAKDRQISDRIVLVQINQATLDGLEYRWPVDRAFLAEVVATVARAKPKVIGLDLLLDKPTEVGKDLLFQRTVERLDVPFVATYATAEGGLTQAEQAFLDGIIPEASRAVTGLVASAGALEIRGLINTAEGEVPTFAAALTGQNRAIEVIDLAKVPQMWEGPFQRYPAETVKSIPPEWFADKIVIIGVDLPARYQVQTVWSSAPGEHLGQIPSMELQAQAVLNLLENSGYRVAPFYVQWGVVLLILLPALLLPAMPWLKKYKATGLAALLVAWSICVWQVAHFGVLLWVLTPLLGLVLASTASVLWQAHRLRHERRFIRHGFAHYVSPEVLEHLQKDPKALRLEGSQRTVAILFTDIEGFTRLSEQVAPEQLVALLNRYLHGVSTLIADHGGMVDKFVGDGVVAIFNAPTDLKDYRLRALTAAIKIRNFTDDFASEQQAAGLGWGRTTIGLLEGEAVLGNLGGQGRLAYTAMGPAMKAASCLEQANRYTGTTLLFSEQFASHLAYGDQKAIEIGCVRLAGMGQALKVWSCLSMNEQEQQYWAEALALAREGEVGRASEIVEKLLNEAPRGSDWAALLDLRLELYSHDPFVEPLVPLK